MRAGSISPHSSNQLKLRRRKDEGDHPRDPHISAHNYDITQ
jgi:hypothetical protein